MDVRSIAAVVSTTALATAGLGVATAQPASPTERVSCQGSPSNAFPDFDASGGAPDIVTGVPGEDVDAGTNGGVVEIRYGGDGVRPKQSLILDAPAQDDLFGAAVTAAHVNDDACEDLLVGVPGRDANGVKDAGAVAVYLGSDGGLRFDSLLVQGKDGIPGEPQRHARFGEALDAFTDTIVVGVPGKDVDGAIGAGAIVELHTDERGFFGTEISQNLPGVPDEAQTGDRWGSSISVYRDNLSVGAPGETVDGAKGAGAVIDRTDGEYTLLTQNSPGMSGLAESDDRFGSAVARHDSDSGAVFIGVPGESTGGVYKAGMVNSWEPGVGPGPAVTQDSPGIAGGGEVEDGFGSALAVYGSGKPNGPYTVQVGVPGEDIRTARDAGMVVTLAYHRADGQRPAEFEGMHGLSADNTAGEIHSGDRFGAVLGLATEAVNDPGADKQLYIGVPGYDGNAGAVVRYVSSDDAELRIQITGASEEGDAYGGALLP